MNIGRKFNPKLLAAFLPPAMLLILTLSARGNYDNHKFFYNSLTAFQDTVRPMNLIPLKIQFFYKKIFPKPVLPYDLYSDLPSFSTQPHTFIWLICVRLRAVLLQFGKPSIAASDEKCRVVEQSFRLLLLRNPVR